MVPARRSFRAALTHGLPGALMRDASSRFGYHHQMNASLTKYVPWPTVCLLLFATACGGGDDKSKDSAKSWRCYEDASGTCECLGSDWVVAGDSISEVDECTGYEVCWFYYAESFEETFCECGGADYMPSEPEEDVSDLEMVESCPTEE